MSYYITEIYFKKIPKKPIQKARTSKDFLSKQDARFGGGNRQS